MLELLRPWALLLLPPVLWWVVWCWRRSGADLDGWRRTAALALRLSACSLLVLALAGLSFPSLDRSLAVVFAVDASDSMRFAEANSTRLERGLELARGAARGLGEDAQAAVIVFGEQAWVESPSHRRLRPEEVQVSSRVRGHATDIAGALELAAAAAPEAAERRVVVLSDGVENHGSALASRDQLASQGVEVLSVPVGTEGVGEVVVREVSAPRRARLAEPIEVRATVAATRPSAARVELYADGALASSQEVALPPGLTPLRFTLRLQRPGMHFFDVLVPSATNDTVVENNRGSAFVKVQERFAVLYVEGEPGEARYLADALAAHDIAVYPAEPANFPRTMRELDAYDAVVISDVSAFNLTASQLRNVESYVRDLGGGLVMVGGARSFGPGGWLNTPVERALPVNVSARRREPRHEALIGLVIDKSGSMGEGTAVGPYSAGGVVSKVEMAKEAAIRAAAYLGPQDYVFVIAFDSAPAWVLHPTSALDMKRIADAIATIQADDGTSMYPAMREAERAFSDSPLPVRHLILLTDGMSEPGDFEGVTKAMVGSGVTVSTVGVGADADVALLKSIASWGGGRSYHTLDAIDIPRIFASDALAATRQMVVSRTFEPRVSGGHAVVKGIDPASVPPLHGYVITEPKEQAEVLALAEKDDPLIAAWRYGLGKSLVFTSDCKSAWARDWLGWEGYSKLWAQAIAWVARQERDRGMTVFLDPAGVNRYRLTVDLIGPDDELLNGADVSATVVAPSGAAQTLAMEQVAPGRYAAEMATGEVGSFIVRVIATREGEVVASANEGVSILYPAELREVGPDRVLLRALSSRSELLDGPALMEAVSRPVERTRRTPNEAWPSLLALALAILPLEVLVRRIFVSEEDVRKALARLRPARAPAAEPEHTRTMGRLLGTKREAREVEAFTVGKEAGELLKDIPEVPGEAKLPPGPPPPEQAQPPPAPPEPPKRETHAGRLLKVKKGVDDGLR